MKKLLIANRGEIARRIVRTARAMSIATVAVHSEADRDAPHVADADEAVRLPGVTAAETYLDVDALLGAAAATGADAVHPGYGFLSENAGFARACARHGIVFVGPSPEAIDAMGSKVAAKEMMAAAGVPVLPGVTVSAGDDLVAAAEVTGFPLLVKAAYGGGGRGMRVVHDVARLADEVESARREAASSFGDDTVFLERFVEHPRHVEVQIFGDSHGEAVHVFERECSIQRRYQKVIEEAPSPAVDDGLRAELCDAAVAAARALDYVGAGTVEFVLGDDRRFFFLEVNTRLQVEHPVTEMVTGVDLVEAQLRVARGEPLPRALRDARLSGCAVEARLYAEDVAAGFVPASGRIDRLRIGGHDHGRTGGRTGGRDGGGIGGRDGVRVDAGYVDGSEVSTHYDAMLAKAIAWAPTRGEAIDRLRRVLAAAEVHGPPTNRDLLVNVLGHADFRAGRTDTGFLERHDCTAPLADAATRTVHAVAAALARQAERRAGATLPSGWRNVPTVPQVATYEDTTVEYRIGRDGITVEVDGRPLDVEVVHAGPDAVDLVVDGVRRTVRVHCVGPTAYVDDAAGSSTLRAVDRFPLPGAYVDPGSLLAPMPGVVARVFAATGDVVAAGETLMVLEAMKMEHRIAAPADGVVATIRVEVGQQVDTGTLLATVEERTEGADVEEG